ncbi:Nte1p, partial [Spiromyces aspiralis]
MLPEAPTFMTSPMDAATCSIPPLYPTLSLPSDNYDIYIYPAGFSNSIPSVWDLVHFVFVSIPIKIPLSLYRLTLYFVKLTLPIKTIAILLLIFLRYGIYYIRVYWLHSTYQKQLPTWALEPKAVPRMDSGYDLHPDLAHPFCVNSAEGMIAQIEAECGSSCSGGFPNKVLGMFMKSIKIFGYLEEPVFHELSRQLQIRRLLAGEVMLDSGRDHNFYVVIEGHVQVYLKPQGCAHRAPGSPPPSHASGLSTSPASASPLSALSPSPSPLPSLPAPSPPLSSPPQMGRSPSPCFPDDLLDDLDGAEIDLRNEYILLNDVHPGGMLSSLFSILYLFTEKIPLRAPPSAPSSPSPDGQDGEQAGQHAAGEGRNPYPDIVARAAVDTTLVMIPADAFHRVTRLYPQAAAHIVQVILTRLLRVTFATLHDYLRLPAELLRVERAVYRTSHRELPESLHA